MELAHLVGSPALYLSRVSTIKQFLFPIGFLVNAKNSYDIWLFLGIHVKYFPINKLRTSGPIFAAVPMLVYELDKWLEGLLFTYLHRRTKQYCRWSINSSDFYKGNFVFPHYVIAWFLSKKLIFSYSKFPAASLNDGCFLCQNFPTLKLQSVICCLK